MSQTQDIHFYGSVKGVVIGDNNTVILEYEDGSKVIVPFLAPPRPQHPFIGRDGLLNTLKKQILDGDKSIALSALNGLPGVGKTALAVALAHDQEVLSYFTGGVLWAGLGYHPNPLSHLGHWMAALGIPDEVIVNTPSCEARKRSIQSKIGNRRMLLVIDDAWDSQDAQWFKIGGPNCAHLLTTRNLDIALDFAGTEGNRVVVSELSLEDSLELLKAFVEEIVEREREEAKKLAIAVGQLPLALVLIGKYLQQASNAQHPESVRQALERLRDREERVNQEQLPSSLQLHPIIPGAYISLYTVIAATDETLNEEGQTVLRRLAVFPAKPDTFSDEAVLAVTKKSSSALYTLHDYGILESAGGGRYTLHQTISDYAVLKLNKHPEEKHTTKYRHSEYFSAFIKQLEARLSSGKPQGALNTVETDIANVRLMWKRGIEQKQKEIIQQASNGLEEFYWLRGWYQEGEDVFDQAMKTFNKEVEEIPTEHEYLLFIARLALFQGRFLQARNLYNEAKPLYERTLRIQEEILGTEHLDVATSLNDLASLYESQGVYPEAERHYKRSREIRQKKLPLNHSDVATALNDLARVYQYQGSCKEAEELFYQSLDIRKTLGTERLNLATSYNNLAALYRSQERNVDAESFYQQALEIWKEVLGEKHPHVATALGNLGELYHAQGKYVKAETFHRQALDIRQEVLGSKHPDVARSFHDLASLALSKGHSEEAEKLYKQALSIQIEFLGPGHPTVATTLSNLAYLYGKQGKYEEAERRCQRALEIRRARLNPEHLDIATSLNNLAMLYYRQGKYDDAEPLYQEALAIQKKAVGPNHPTVASLLDHLAALYHIQKVFSQAEQFYQQALEIRREVFGSDHPAVAKSLVNLAWLFQTQGNHSRVKQLAQQALQIANSLENEAERHASQEDDAAAEACYREALQLKEDILGKSHHKVLKLVDNLALLYYSQGKYQEAETFFKRELAHLVTSLKKDDPRTLKISEYLEDVKEKLAQQSK